MSINVRGLANAAIQVVNPNIAASYLRSTGSVTDAAGKRAPSYAAPVTVQIQAQAAKSKDLEHVENLNMQGVYKNVRMWGDTQGIVRPEAKGGDLLLFPNVPAGTNHTWLVVAVLETWPAWCSVIACLQTDPAIP